MSFNINIIYIIVYILFLICQLKKLPRCGIIMVLYPRKEVNFYERAARYCKCYSPRKNKFKFGCNRHRRKRLPSFRYDNANGFRV